MTPDSKSGNLNYGVNEYIGSMRVDPKSYFNISDQRGDENYVDPYIKENTVTRKKKDFTEEELISQMWAGGNYLFRFEIVYSNQSQPTIIKINLSPSDLWDFRYEREYVHSTEFRHSKYTYTINPDKFVAKWVDLSSRNIAFGKWDLSQEALERYISIFEEDKKETKEYTSTYDMNVMTSSKVNGSIKFGLGTNQVASGEIGTDVSTSTTRRITKSVKTIRSEEDDYLGTIKIYFYDPVIINMSKAKCSIPTYTTGTVEFTLLVK